MRWDNKDPQSNPFISRTTISTGYSAPACGGSPAKRARGNAFPRPPGRLYGFSRQRRHKKWRRRRRTSPVGTVSQPIGKPFNGQAKGLLWLTWRSYAGPPQYYITPEDESPQPVREASAGPGQNPGSPGPKGPAAGSTLTPVRACQPSGIPESTAKQSLHKRLYSKRR